jgi:hypothetical protein
MCDHYRNQAFIKHSFGPWDSLSIRSLEKLTNEARNVNRFPYRHDQENVFLLGKEHIDFAHHSLKQHVLWRALYLHQTGDDR